MANKRGFAPYNFIPFYTGKVPVRYTRTQDSDNLPAFNAGNKDAHSGYVDYQIQVLTDLAVGDNQSEADKDAGEHRRFYRDGEGRIAIPGSTMRGFVRSATEILSFVCPEAIEDRIYQFRDFAGICHASKNEYQSFFAVDKNSKAGTGVKAGKLYRENGKYYIQPLAAIPGMNATYGKIKEDELDQYITKFPQEYQRMYDDSGNENPMYRPYRSKTPVHMKTQRASVILLNSAFIAGKKHHYIVSSTELGAPLVIDDQAAQRYRSDYEHNCIQNNTLKEQAYFYALPDSDGKENGSIYFYKVAAKDSSKVIGFGPTPYFRIPYQNSTRRGLPMFYDKKSGIDYVTSMFGYISEVAANSNDTGYKSRLSFQNAILVGALDEDKDLVDRDFVLMSPKGSAFDMYLQQDGRRLDGDDDKTGLMTYNNKDFVLRGHKIYWKRSKVTGAKGEAKDAVTSHLQVLKAGDGKKTFAGRVYFDNLHDDEIGLLLMSLQYKDSKTETRLLGSAKPYGYGKVAVSVSGLHILDDETRFTELSPKAKDMRGEVESYRQKYRDKINTLLPDGRTFEEENSIKVYEKWLESNDMSKDDGVSRKGYVYMPIEEQSDYSEPLYGTCEPMKSAAEILEVDVKKETICKTIAAATLGTQMKAHNEDDYGLEIATDYNGTGEYFWAKAYGAKSTSVCKGRNVRCYIKDADAMNPLVKELLKKGARLYAEALLEISGEKDRRQTSMAVLKASAWYQG